MHCKLKSYIIFIVLAMWLGAIIIISLLFSTSDLKEGFFPSETTPFNLQSLEDIHSPPSNSDSSLNILEGNKVSAECCPASYTTSNGCVCLTQEQLELIRNRGGNKIPTEDISTFS